MAQLRKKRYYLFYLTISILIIGCNSQAGRNTGDQSEFYVIDFEQCFNTEQQMFISEIADEVEYLELKTPDDIVITKIVTVIPFDDYLIVTSRSIAYLFHRNGQFIRKIGNIGQGPGEYAGVYDIVLDVKNKEILISDTYQLLYYDLEGNYLRNKKMRVLSLGISDSILWSGGEIALANEPYKAIAVSLYGEGDTLASIPNTLYGTIKSDEVGTSSSSIFITLFYHKNDSLYFKGDGSNDTIWRISGLTATPHAFINMGKYKLPPEYERWASPEKYEMNYDRYWCVPSVVEDDNYFYLFSYWRKFNFALRRYAEDKYIVYDKKAGKGFSTKDRNGIGLTDDILGGPPFWPRWSSNEYFISAIEAYELLEKVEAGGYTPSETLKGLLSRIGEDTNQLLVLCRRKK